MIPDSDLFVRFRHPQERPDYITDYELNMTLDTRYLQPLLYFLARTIHAKTIVEIGIGKGGSTLPLLKAVSEMQGGMLHGVDPQVLETEPRRIVDRYELRHCWTWHQMTSDAFFAGPGTNLEIDFAFVDGDHIYDAVGRDAHNVLQRLVPGGIVVFHEYECHHIPPWEQIMNLPQSDVYSGDRYEDAAAWHTKAGEHATPRVLRTVLPQYDVDIMPLDHGACGLDRVAGWTEAGALMVRKRFPNEFQVCP